MTRALQAVGLHAGTQFAITMQTGSHKCKAMYAGMASDIPLSLYPDYDRRPWNHTRSADLAHA